MTKKKASSSPKKKSGPGVIVCRKCGIVGGVGGGSEYRKGPWTAEEDALLMEYVRNHGEKHWKCVQKTGLMRCGKSCRLRWTNHLRPDLKKGAFTPEEERMVSELHAQLGNKWSKIAAKLPGRTDNEVKNFWNTKIKRKIKVDESPSGPENPESSNHQDASAFYLEHHNNYQQAQTLRDPPSLPSSPSFTSLFSPCSIHIPGFDASMHHHPSDNYLHIPFPAPNLINSMQNDPIISFLNNPAYKLKYHLEEEEDNNDYQAAYGSTLPFASTPFSSTPYNNSLAYFVDSIGQVDDVVELPSSQTMINPISTPLSSSSPLMVGNYLQGNNIGEEESSWSMNQQKCCMEYGVMNETSGGVIASASAGKELDDSTGPVHSSSEINRRKEALEDVEPIDDDLSSLLNDFSSIESPPQWYLTEDNWLNSHHNEGSASLVPAAEITYQECIDQTHPSQKE